MVVVEVEVAVVVVVVSREDEWRAEWRSGGLSLKRSHFNLHKRLFWKWSLPNRGCRLCRALPCQWAFKFVGRKASREPATADDVRDTESWSCAFQSQVSHLPT